MIRKKLPTKLFAILISVCLLKNFAFAENRKANNKENVKKVTQNEHDRKLKTIKNNIGFDYDKMFESENLLKAHFKVNEKNLYIKGIISRIIDNLILREFTDKLKVTAEFIEEKSSFLDMIKGNKPYIFKKDPGICFALGTYENKAAKKDMVKEKIKKFLNSDFKNKIKKIKISEKDIEKAIFEVAVYLNGEYQSEKCYLEDQKKENINYFKKGLSMHDWLSRTYKNSLPENVESSLEQKFKNNKKAVTKFGKTLDVIEKKEIEKYCKECKTLIKDLLKFLTGNNSENNAEKTFKEYEKTEKNSTATNDKLQNFILNCFNKNPKKQNIINNIISKIKNMPLNENYVSLDKYFYFKMNILSHFKYYEKYMNAIFNSFKFSENEKKDIINYYKKNINSFENVLKSSKHYLKNKNDEEFKLINKYILNQLEKIFEYIKKKIK